MDDRTRRLLEAPPTGLLIRLATPNAIAFLIQSVVSLAEVWFIGRLGTQALAAIALGFPALMLTQAMSGGAFGGGVASAVARALGAGDRERADALIWHVLVIAAAGAAVFLVAFLLFGELFLLALGGYGEVLEAAERYTLVLFGGGLSLWLMGMVSAVYRGSGNMQFPAFLMIGSAFVQVPLTACLVQGAYGFPQLGIVGAAVSAVIAATLSSLVMILRLTGTSQTVRLHRGAFGLKRELFADVMRVAAPASLSPLLTIGTILALTALVGRFGEAALAGYGIGS
ncbi:MAG: MATE family efflux transporter, partial [Pseudomonadales bacterium]|nr:MATE family efflux transporter [Pseudomonadales bacterium]